MVPTIVRGAKPGAGGKNLTPHFWHGGKSSASAATLSGNVGPWRQNIAANEVSEHLLSRLRPNSKNAVKKIAESPTPFATALNGPYFPPYLKGDDGWATEH